MMTMMILSLVLAAGFVLAVSIRHGIPKSISAIAYHTRWLWTLWIWAVAFLLCPALVDAMPHDMQMFGFFTVTALVFTGAMPLFMEEQEKIHTILGVITGVLSQVCVLLISPLWLVWWLLFVIPMICCIKSEKDDGTCMFKDYDVLVSEMICCMTTYGALLFN